MKKAVYLDTTILSYLVDEREGIRNFIDVTKNWWNTQRKYYHLFLSEDTMVELKRGKYPNKDKALKEADKIEILGRVENIDRIVGVYIENHLMPRKFEGDAFHLAYASFYKVDFLLTWNCNHLANANKRQHIRIINTRLGLAVPEIVTPLELFIEEEK